MTWVIFMKRNESSPLILLRQNFRIFKSSLFSHALELQSFFIWHFKNHLVETIQLTLFSRWILRVEDHSSSVLNSESWALRIHSKSNYEEFTLTPEIFKKRLEKQTQRSDSRFFESQRTLDTLQLLYNRFVSSQGFSNIFTVFLDYIEGSFIGYRVPLSSFRSLLMNIIG